MDSHDSSGTHLALELSEQAHRVIDQFIAHDAADLDCAPGICGRTPEWLNSSATSLEWVRRTSSADPRKALLNQSGFLLHLRIE